MNSLSQIRIVLCRPRMPANVGAAARAMKVMGLGGGSVDDLGEAGQLYLVAPHAYSAAHSGAFDATHPEAIALASGADDVLARAKLVDDLDAALVDCHAAIAMTARPREWGGTVAGLPETIAQFNTSMYQGKTIAFVFGNERTGLDNAEILRCNHVCHIDTNPD